MFYLFGKSHSFHTYDTNTNKRILLFEFLLMITLFENFFIHTGGNMALFLSLFIRSTSESSDNGHRSKMVQIYSCFLKMILLFRHTSIFFSKKPLISITSIKVIMIVESMAYLYKINILYWDEGRVFLFPRYKNGSTSLVLQLSSNISYSVSNAAFMIYRCLNTEN